MAPTAKPQIRTDCPAAAADLDNHQTAELFWPGAQVGALLQLSTTTTHDGHTRTLLDVYRADPSVLVRCSAEHLQAPAQPLGTTLASYSRRQLALEQVANDAQPLLTLLQGCGAMEGLPALQQLALQLQHSVQKAHEANND